MKNPFGSQALPFDASKITDTIQRALAAAGLDTTSGPMRSVTDTIQRALSPGVSVGPARPPVQDPSVIDIAARVIGSTDDIGEPARRGPVTVDPPARGTFVTREFGNHAGRLAYKLYVPKHEPASPMPMVVMLHGCTQSAEDFAAGTRMNRLAEEHGFLVVYPEQAAHANVSKCWNWFQSQDQLRDSGEPAMIAGIVRDLARQHDVDPRRIFVAGLSAGAAMAVIMGETYPELFAAVGVHSGLPYGSAHDIPSALAAMKGGRSGRAGARRAPRAAATRRKTAAQAVPTIVFHGDRDHTVQHSNAAEIIQQATDAHVAAAGMSALQASTQRATAPGGRSYSRTVHADASGQPRLEAWTLHGAGHAWSGGDASGTYTDASGPDASAEMVRFFLARPGSGSA
jgi:poly(hydroxyalkanoate) depolymerase family esterase